MHCEIYITYAINYPQQKQRYMGQSVVCLYVTIAETTILDELVPVDIWYWYQEQFEMK